MSFETILPFLRPIAALIQDPDVSEIMVNASKRVFVERDGRLAEAHGVELDERHVRVAVKNIARALGEDISEERPILDARLPDGSRVAAVFAPCSVGGTTLTIRKFLRGFLSADELARDGFITATMVESIRTAITERNNVLISGGTGVGKTTLLNALAGLFPDDDRIVLIEDTAELRIDKTNLVRFEARRAQGDVPAVTIRELLRATLRHRPDRIIVGEVRGAEAFDLLQALNTGHSGSMSTIHANSALHALSRCATCVLQADVGLPYAAITRLMADSVHIVLHLERVRGVRRVSEAVRVAGVDPHDGRIQTVELR